MTIWDVEFCEDLGIEWAMGMKGMGWNGLVFQYVFYTRPPTGDSNALNDFLHTLDVQ